MSRLTQGGTAEPPHEIKFSGANAEREILFFPVELTTSRIGNLTRLIHTLAICVTIWDTKNKNFHNRNWPFSLRRQKLSYVKSKIFDWVFFAR